MVVRRVTKESPRPDAKAVPRRTVSNARARATVSPRGTRAVYRASSAVYRASSAGELDDEGLEQALKLLRENESSALARARPAKLVPFLKAKPTWATVGTLAADAITARLLGARNDNELLRASVDAKELHARLLERDATRTQRVTSVLRNRIQQLQAVGACLDELKRIKAGQLAPSMDTAGRASVLHRRWIAIGGDKQDAAVRTLLEAATGKVLSSNAEQAIKGLYMRGLGWWLPQPPQLTAAPSGERVQWTDEDDGLL